MAINQLPTKEEARRQIAAQYPDFDLLSLKVRTEEKASEFSIVMMSVTNYYLECQSAGISVQIQPPHLGFLWDHGYPE